MLGEVENVPYKRMGTNDLAQSVAEHIKTHQALLMENHGVITVGTELLSAFDRIELLEQAAMMTCIAFGLPGSHSLTAEQIKELDDMKQG